jgi:oxygen-independent coproporphyrinogen-3 oxidase
MTATPPPSIPGLPSESRIQEIFEALGYFNYLTFAPPNIYPMSAPAFQKAEHAPRPAYTEVGGPIGIYAHIPFCNYACSFCFYAKRIGETRETMARYVDALEKELTWIPPGTPLTQLFVGGGTPTALPPELLDRTLTAIFRNVVRGPITHTVECSPDSLTDAHIDVLLKHQIGRVSMGIQSTHDDTLDHIRRKHAGEAALATCAKLVSRGLMVNVDLIYGLPAQTHDHFRRDLDLVSASGAHSITAYNLRVNERTPVAQKLAEDERLGPQRLIRWRAFVRHTAAELGYRQTRGHTFVRSTGADPGSQRAATFRDLTSHGQQFSVGLSSRSRLNGTIYRNNADLAAYLDCIESGRSPVHELFPLDASGSRLRYIALSLGEGEPLDRADYQRTFGTSFDEDFAVPLQITREAALIADSPDATTLGLTSDGKLIYDKVLLAFYPDEVKQWLKDREQSAVARGRLQPVPAGQA